MTTRILQVANSAFYGAQKISSLERALIQLGTNVIKDITLTVSIASQMTWKPHQLQTLLKIFQHSAHVSRLTAELHVLIARRQLAEADSSAALTHDIGKIILLQYYPDLYDTILKRNASDDSLSFFDAEKSISQLGASHCEIGAYFLSRWNLPGVNVSAALYHHDPQSAAGKDSELIHMISLANRLSHLLPRISEQKWLDVTQDTVYSSDQRKAFLARALEAQA